MRYIFLIILLSICSTAFAQHQKLRPLKWPPTIQDDIKAEINYECLFINKYSKLQRRQFYPFSKAQSIILVSYDTEEGLPVKNKMIVTQKVKERVELTVNQIDSLTSMLYNVGYTPVNDLRIRIGNPGASCYDPRNAILFANASGKIFEYIEICFECQRIEKSSAKVNAGIYCDNKYELLRKFFSEAGVKYGTQERFPILTYKAIFALDTSEMITELNKKLNAKAVNGKNLDLLNDTERTLFLSLKADVVHSQWNNGFIDFYISVYSNYYQQTLAALKTIGAELTLKAFQQSALQWPYHKVPEDIWQRRKIIIEHTNKLNTAWKKLQDELIIKIIETGTEYDLSKEPIETLAYKFAMAHQNDLKD